MKKLREVVLKGQVGVKVGAIEEFVGMLTLVYGEGMGASNEEMRRVMKERPIMHIVASGVMEGLTVIEAMDIHLPVVGFYDAFEDEEERVTGELEERVVTCLDDLKENLVSPFGLIGVLDGVEYRIYEELNERGKIKTYNTTLSPLEAIVSGLQRFGFYVRYEGFSSVDENRLAILLLVASVVAHGEEGNFVVRIEDGRLLVSLKARDLIVYDNPLENHREITEDLPSFGIKLYSLDQNCENKKTNEKKAQELVSRLELLFKSICPTTSLDSLVEKANSL